MGASAGLKLASPMRAAIAMRRWVDGSIHVGQLETTPNCAGREPEPWPVRDFASSRELVSATDPPMRRGYRSTPKTSCPAVEPPANDLRPGSARRKRKAKTITAAGATFIHLDLEQGAIANALCSQQQGWRQNTDPQQNGSNDLGGATKSRSHAEPAVGIPMLASLERQTLLNHDRPLSSHD